MQAIILAAGMGKRLKSLTAENTKCMVRVNGVSLIERALRQLDGLGLSRVVIVVGYRGRRLIDYIGSLAVKTPIVYVENPIYDQTNNIYSLYLARDELASDDTLLLESDLIFEDSILEDLVDDPRPTLALVDKYESWMDGTVVKLDPEDRIEAFVPGKKLVFADIPEYYKTVNIYKFSREFSRAHYIPFLEAYSKALGNNEYYEQVLRVITLVDDTELRAKRLDGQLWYEIDDLQDLDIAESIFAGDAGGRLSALQGRYGGYWRYPRLLDFCYLVNPYYPPQRLVEEMKASFERLLTQYPSGMRVNSLLAAKLFGVERGRIVVGNGAAELIRALLAGVEGRVGVVRPTFDEYPNRLRPGQEVAYRPKAPGFAYGADDLIAFFGAGDPSDDVEALVLINPDNPTGNYLPRLDVERLAIWAEDRGVRLVVDESFIDFAEDEGASLIDDATLAAHPSLVVVKSISKSFGVPGARLGVLASGDEKLIGELKRSLPIWNINSFGEFYLQIAEKYLDDYREALGRFRFARARLAEDLAAIPGLRVLPSQANYFMVELVGGVTSRELTARLLARHNILVKDLSPKLGGEGQYVRLAIRTEEDNGRLVKALQSELGNPA